MARNYITTRIRREFREAMTWIPLGRIRDYFEGEGFEDDESAATGVSGARRSLVEQFYAAIDWSRWSDCERLLRVYEAVLDDPAVFDGYDGDARRPKLLDVLVRDGIELDSRGSLRPTWEPFGSDVVEQLPSESAVHRDLARMREAIESEPDAAVGAAKDAVESAIKYGLHTLGVKLTGKEKLPELADALHRELGLHPGGVAPDTKGEKAVKKVLGSFLTQVQALAELRNLYGVGKGRVTRSGLSPRHARLAAHAATGYVTFILDTLQDENAPWRKDREGAATA